MRRITKAALGSLAGGAFILVGTQVAGGALTGIYKFDPDDMKPLSANGTLDSAKAKITITESTGSTTFDIRVTGINPDAAGTLFGSHLHTGPCVKGDGASAGPHYNHDVAQGITPARINTETEVWFDIVPDADGMAQDQTTVKFVPIDSDPDRVPGVMSVVIHELSTNPTTGGAGARWACFPLDVPQWAPAPATE
jgi:Cu-Zn family superoxide dismutase